MLEDGTHVAVADALPPDLPLGYHDLHPSDGGPTTRLIVVPDRCAPAPSRAWGWAVQLYAARSRASWGIGDLGRPRHARSHGRRRTAPGSSCCRRCTRRCPGRDPEPSPYFASSRRWRNPLHLRVEDVPGFDGTDDDSPTSSPPSARARPRPRSSTAPRCGHAKREALDRIWARVRGRLEEQTGFVRYWDAQGRRSSCTATPPSARWPSTTAAAGRAGPPSTAGPTRPASPASPPSTPTPVTFHAWVQWLLDRQLAAAADGAAALRARPRHRRRPRRRRRVDRGRTCSRHGVRVGAPPDEFNADGQDWGLPPFVPWKLRAAGYEPFAELLRGAFEHGAGLRVDHVMGLFRLWWIPPRASTPREGGYVRFPDHELLDILALESARAGAFVVGEDLGTVEDDVRAALAERDVLSYRLAWFEPEPPERWPEQALAALTTHDLPTLAGVVAGADDRRRRARGAACPLRRRRCRPIVELTVAPAAGVVAVPARGGHPRRRPRRRGAPERARHDRPSGRTGRSPCPVPIDDLADAPRRRAPSSKRCATVGSDDGLVQIRPW